MESSDLKAAGMINKLTEPLMDLITNFFRTKVDEFSKTPNRPSINEAPSIVNEYALKCAGVSGFASLAPGPFGLLTIIPDIIMVLRLQTEMLAKLSAAYRKEKFVTKEIVLFMLFQGVGSLGISFVIVKSSQLIVKRASARLIQKIVTMLGGRILQRTISQAASRFIPIIGPIAMAIWIRHMTKKIGNEAMNILSKEIVIEGEFDEEDFVDETNETINEEIEKAEKVSPLQEIKKLKILIKVAQADGLIHEKERKLFIESIEKSKLIQVFKDDLIAALTPEKDIELVLPKLTNEDEKVDFMIQLIAMAKIDADFSQKEKALLFDIGKKLDLNDDDVKVLF